MKKRDIPRPAVERLAILYRLLTGSLSESDRPLSSAKLGELTGVPAHTVRKDISYLSEAADTAAGTATDPATGTGYDPARLRELIGNTLGLTRSRRACIAGLGRLGSAILDYSGFTGSEFTLKAGFDSSVNRIELLKTTVPLYPSHQLETIVRRESIELGIIAVPEHAAEEIAARMFRAGIRGVINFAPIILRSGTDDVWIRNISVLGELTVLSAFLSLAGGTDGGDGTEPAESGS